MGGGAAACSIISVCRSLRRAPVAGAVAWFRPAATARYELEYFLEARDLAGQPIARVAGPETPLSLVLEPGSVRRERPWYARWYTVAGGAAVVGVGATLFFTTGGDTGDGSLEPGRITLTP